MLQRFLLLWLILLSLLAFGWPAWFGEIPDPFRATAAGLNVLFAVTMLAIGSLLPADEIRQVARRWPTVLGGTTVQYLAMPLLAYALARLFQLEGAALIGVLVAGCVPGAMASNVLTLIARGNVSYSVSLTALATLVSPLVVPAALWLFLRRWIQLDVLQMMWQLSWMVVIPVLAGHLLRRTFAGWAQLSQRFGATIANLSVLWIIAVVVAQNRDRLTQVDSSLLLALLALNVLGFLAGFLGGWAMRLPPPMRRALVLEVGMQNAGLGTVLATHFFGPETALAPAIYTFGCMFSGTLLARFWSWKSSVDLRCD
jgi:BASS family bile acid:Na+ symporter